MLFYTSEYHCELRHFVQESSKYLYIHFVECTFSLVKDPVYFCENYRVHNQIIYLWWCSMFFSPIGLATSLAKRLELEKWLKSRTWVRNVTFDWWNCLLPSTPSFWPSPGCKCITEPSVTTFMLSLRMSCYTDHLHNYLWVKSPKLPLWPCQTFVTPLTLPGPL